MSSRRAHGRPATADMDGGHPGAEHPPPPEDPPREEASREEETRLLIQEPTLMAAVLSKLEQLSIKEL